MNIERMMDDMPLRVLGNVCHQFFATEVQTEYITFTKVCLLKEIVNSLPCGIYLIRLIAHRAVERPSSLTIRNQGEGRDTTALTATVSNVRPPSLYGIRVRAETRQP